MNFSKYELFGLTKGTRSNTIQMIDSNLIYASCHNEYRGIKGLTIAVDDRRRSVAFIASGWLVLSRKYSQSGRGIDCATGLFQGSRNQSGGAAAPRVDYQHWIRTTKGHSDRSYLVIKPTIILSQCANTACFFFPWFQHDVGHPEATMNHLSSA